MIELMLLYNRLYSFVVSGQGVDIEVSVTVVIRIFVYVLIIRITQWKEGTEE